MTATALSLTEMLPMSQVHVTPAERHDFAPTHPRSERRVEERVEAMRLRKGEEADDLLRGPAGDFRLVLFGHTDSVKDVAPDEFPGYGLLERPVKATVGDLDAARREPSLKNAVDLQGGDFVEALLEKGFEFAQAVAVLVVGVRTNVAALAFELEPPLGELTERQGLPLQDDARIPLGLEGSELLFGLRLRLAVKRL